MEVENKHQSLLLRQIGCLSKSIVTTVMEAQLSFLHMVIHKTLNCAINTYNQHPYLYVDVHLPLLTCTEWVTLKYAFNALKKANKQENKHFLQKVKML